jgi:hypothetical protein
MKQILDQKDWGLLLLILVIVLILFGRVVTFSFINWDDDINVYKNEVFNAPNTLQNIWFSLKLPSYHPITFSLFYLQWKLYPHPLVFHIFSFILHLANLFLFYYVLRSIKVSPILSFFIVLIYGVHPMRVECVAWITEQKSLLSGVFIWLSFISYLKYIERKLSPFRRKAAFVLVVLFYLLALLSKPTVFPFILVLPFYHYFILGEQPDFSWLKILIVLGCVAVFVLAVNWLRESQNFAGTVADSIPLFVRVFIASKSILYYMLKTAIPIHMLPIYPRWNIFNDFVGDYLPVIVFLAITGYILYSFFTRNTVLSRWLAFGYCSYIVSIATLSGIVTIPYMNTAFICDRYSYFAGVFLILILVFIVDTVFKKYSHYVLILFSLVCMYITAAYLPAWKNSDVFWTYVLDRNADCSSAYTNYGYYLMNKPDATVEDIEKAFALQQACIRLEPNNTLSYYNSGVCLQKLGNLEEAEKFYRKALELDPQYSDVWNDLGVVYELMEKYEDAVNCFKKALEHSPGHPYAMNNLSRLQQDHKSTGTSQNGDNL